MTRRPAETAGAAGAIAGLICYVAGIRDVQVFAYVTAVVGLVPAVVTTLYEADVKVRGLRGLARLVWRGDPGEK